MISINENNKLCLGGISVDLQIGFNTLSGIVNQHRIYRPTDGGVYIFYNRQRNTLK